jgi:hypothetical protein
MRDVSCESGETKDPWLWSSIGGRREIREASSPVETTGYLYLSSLFVALSLFKGNPLPATEYKAWDRN